MALIKRSRTAQYPLVAETVFNYNDGVPYLSALNAASQDGNNRATVQDLGSKAAPTGLLNNMLYQANVMSAAPTYFELISLPAGSQVIGGQVIIEEPYVGPSTVTLMVGDAQAPALYHGTGAGAAITVKGTAFTNQPTTLTNAGADPMVCTMGNATANGITAVGQVIKITGCTGASAAYNGTFTVDSYSATSVVFTNPNLSTSLTLAGSLAAIFSAAPAALLVPSSISAGGLSGAQDAARGVDMRATLTFGDTAAATAGRIRVRVMYTLDGRQNEIQPA